MKKPTRPTVGRHVRKDLRGADTEKGRQDCLDGMKEMKQEHERFQALLEPYMDDDEYPPEYAIVSSRRKFQLITLIMVRPERYGPQILGTCRRR